MAGCGGSGHIVDGPEAYPAQGTLIVDGEPAVGADVTLHPADGQDFDTRGSRPTGRADEKGVFVLSTYDVKDGAPPGDYVATIYWAVNPNSIEPSPDRLGNRFLKPGDSEFRVHIDEGENTIPPIQIKTK